METIVNDFNVVLLGDFDTAEMEPIAQWISERIAAGCLASHRGVDDFSRDVESGSEFVNLIVVAQSHPDGFSRRDVHTLITLAPLARIVCCYGAWCASEGRTRDVWPQAVRVPVESALDRIEKEFEVLAGKRIPLPLTASRDEAFAFDAGAAS